jgi:hypothetical protein
LIQKISEKIQETYSALPLPNLTNHTSKQGGFLPRKLQKEWKNHLSTYHLIRKAIYLTKNTPNWQTHRIIEELKNHIHAINPLPPNHKPNQHNWIKTLAEIAKSTNIEARKITT